MRTLRFGLASNAEFGVTGAAFRQAAIIKESLATIRHIMEAGAAHLLVLHGPAIAALIAAL